MGAGENSALDLPAPSLPSGVTAKMLLSTAPYNAQNPQTNQVVARTCRFPPLLFLLTPGANWMHFWGRLSTAMPSTTSSSGAPSSRGRSTKRARRSRSSSSPSALRLGYAPGRSCWCFRALPRIQIPRGGSLERSGLRWRGGKISPTHSHCLAREARLCVQTDLWHAYGRLRSGMSSGRRASSPGPCKSAPRLSGRRRSCAFASLTVF